MRRLFASFNLALVLLCASSQSSADDWHVAEGTMEKGCWQSNVDFYRRLSGRFSSSVLLSFGALKCHGLALVRRLVASIRCAAFLKFKLPQM